jgi:ribosomal protein S18 acetylase RimI-like enzyme
MLEKYKNIPVLTYYLEMLAPFPIKELKISDDIILIQAKNITTEYYLFLYHLVGSNYGWTGRLIISNDELKQQLSNPNNLVYILLVSGVPAGFFEIELHSKSEAELLYFGLSAQFQGKGLGSVLMNRAIKAVQNQGINCFKLHTCEFDSSTALSFYKKNGFQIYDEKIVNEIYPVDFLEKNNMSSV